jgi:DNA-binding transcriptional regulator YiaG
MANMAKVLKDEISRISRREGRALTAKLNRQSAQYRRDLAALKRTIAQQGRKLAFLEGQERKRVGAPAADISDDAANSARFQARGLKSHRAKTGLSAADYGKLIGVSGQTVYMWEQGKTKPRRKQIAALASIRTLGKREAQQRLELL